jgi:hypothetical protein
MNESRHYIDRNSSGVRAMCRQARMILLVAIFGVNIFGAVAQAQAQQSGSLGDAARQSRAQKQSDAQDSVSPAQQVANELSEDQNDSAPGGFKTFNAGDYKVWVPAPYTVDGRDDAGTVLSGPAVGSKRPMILVGSPIISKGNTDDAFQDAATQFAHLYSQTATCTKSTIAGQGAYVCGLAAANLLGRQVSGNAVFVQRAGNIYPVFCLAPSDSRYRDILNNPRSSSSAKVMARESLEREEGDMKAVWQKCDTVFQSVHIRDGAVRQAAQSGAASGGVTAGAGSASLADIARRLKQDPGQAAAITTASAAQTTAEVAPGSTVPAGLKVQAFQYCAAVHQCWDASVLIPSDAKLISSDCKQYAFEIKVQGQPFLLMAGPAGGECDGGTANSTSLVRWKELVDPENRRAPGTYTTISAQTRKLDGKAASIITMGFRKGLTQWMGKRAEVENNGIQIVVGCLAQRDYFADGDAVCSALIESLRLP